MPWEKHAKISGRNLDEVVGLVPSRASAVHRNCPRQFGGGISRIVRVLWRKQWVEDFHRLAIMLVVLSFNLSGSLSAALAGSPPRHSFLAF